MNKKRLLGLIIFSSIVIAAMFFGAMFMIRDSSNHEYNQSQIEADQGETNNYNEDLVEAADESFEQGKATNANTEGEWLFADSINKNNQEDNQDSENDETVPSESDGEQINTINPTEDEVFASGENITIDEDVDGSANPGNEGQENIEEIPLPTSPDSQETIESTDITDALAENALDLPDMQLIRDSSQVDYMKHVPEIIIDSKIEVALDIENPSININAKSAILLDGKTGEVLYYKDPVLPVFPASTSKLLTTLVALDWCMEEEEVTVGDELKLVASDSSLAGLKKGQCLTIRNLIEAMLLPSGNDAAYVTAAYVGRKSLKNDNASLKESLPEFIRLMNKKAKSLGVMNSSFKTPDGYDAIGQYTTAYDMGMIGMAAADNEIILEVSKKSSAKNTFVDGSVITWNNTNSLINKESGRYYSSCIGLKTGTSTMAGKCLVSVAKKDERIVISVVMNSDATGRWEDSSKLLKYGLEN